MPHTGQQKKSLFCVVKGWAQVRRKTADRIGPAGSTGKFHPQICSRFVCRATASAIERGARRTQEKHKNMTQRNKKRSRLGRGKETHTHTHLQLSLCPWLEYDSTGGFGNSHGQLSVGVYFKNPLQKLFPRPCLRKPCMYISQKSVWAALSDASAR